MARPISPDSIPSAPGIYSIWKIHRSDEKIAAELSGNDCWEECLYIGQASNLRNRINQHYLLLKYLVFSGEMKVKYQEFPSTSLNAIEACLIRAFNPKLNRVGLPHARAVPLTEAEWREMKAKLKISNIIT